MEGSASLMLQFFLCFGLSFLASIMVVLLAKWYLSRPWWCTCSTCKAYLTSSWAGEFENLCDWYSHLLASSPTRTIHVHILNNVVTANPANVEHMLRANFANYPKGKPFSSILGDLLGRGIFNADGASWQFQRKMASLELGSVSVRSYAFRIVSHEIRQRLLPLLTSSVSAGRVIDLQDVFRRFSFDAICKISFGLDPGCLELSLPMSEFATAFDAASRLSAMRATVVSPLVWKAKKLLNLGSERQLRRAIKLVNELAQEVIRQRRKMGFSTRHDLLSRFMGSVDDGTYLQDIVVSFLLAGRDTVASSLTSFFFLLSKHPRVESAIVEEITTSMTCSDDQMETPPSYEQMRGLHYVHAALYETMRLHPPVQFDSKFALEDDVLPDGTHVEKGTRMTYHPYAMGRMEDVWGNDCTEFRPERWLDEAGGFVPANAYAYPVFQAGLRVCLGKEMALMEMKSVVVSVLQRFRVDVVDSDRPAKFSSGLTASLAGGLPARIRPRNF